MGLAYWLIVINGDSFITHCAVGPACCQCSFMQKPQNPYQTEATYCPLLAEGAYWKPPCLHSEDLFLACDYKKVKLNVMNVMHSGLTHKNSRHTPAQIRNKIFISCVILVAVWKTHEKCSSEQRSGGFSPYGNVNNLKLSGVKSYMGMLRMLRA